MEKEVVCSKAIEKGAGVPVFQGGFEVEEGCPIFSNIEFPVTVRKLAEVGRFDPKSWQCNRCSKNLNYRRCMPIYRDMPIEQKFIIDSILENRPGFVERTTVECYKQIP